MKNLINVPKEITKQAIRSEAQRIIDEVMNGNIDPVRTQLFIRTYEDVIKEVKKGIKNEVILSAEKYVNDESFPAKVSISETGDRYNYEADQEYSDIKKALKAREEKLKAACKNGAPITDKETGELIEPCPVKSYSEVVVKIEFRK